jgi:hypothetical protein
LKHYCNPEEKELGMKNKRLKLLLIIFCLVLCIGVTEAKSKKNQWYSFSYNIELSYHYTSQCNPGYCEGEKILDLVANVYNIAFGHSPAPAFPCWLYQRSGKNMIGQFGHGEGDAKIVTIEMCPHLSGAGEEPNKIVNRNNNFDINLTILPQQAAEDYIREKYGYDEDTLIPKPLVEEVWMQFQAMTPFSNPAVEWENSDGNGLANTWTVFFNVPIWKLKKSEEIKIQIPEGDECGKGVWSIWFSPQKKK